jgi:hypothetical protein
MRHPVAAVLFLFIFSGLCGIRTIGAQAGAPSRGRSSAVTIVRVTVPPLIKLLVGPAVGAEGGRPAISIVTNIPSLQAGEPTAMDTVAAPEPTVRPLPGEAGVPLEPMAKAVGRGSALRYTICPP